MRQDSAVPPSGNGPLHPESSNILDYQAADARWFRRHPDRQYRFRKAYIGEPFAPHGHPVTPVPAGFFESVIVAQIKPGFRTRSRLVHSEMPSRALMNSDSWIARIHQEFCPKAVAVKRRFDTEAAQ